MPVSITYWTADGQAHSLTAPTTGQLFDQALAAGAVRVQTPDGEIFRRIGGEMVYIGSARPASRPAGARRRQSRQRRGSPCSIE